MIGDFIGPPECDAGGGDHPASIEAFECRYCGRFACGGDGGADDWPNACARCWLRLDALTCCVGRCPACGLGFSDCDCGGAECIGRCGRRTNAFESHAPGYCIECAHDPAWVSIDWIPGGAS